MRAVPGQQHEPPAAEKQYPAGRLELVQVDKQVPPIGLSAAHSRRN